MKFAFEFYLKCTNRDTQEQEMYDLTIIMNYVIAKENNYLLFHIAIKFWDYYIKPLLIIYILDQDIVHEIAMQSLKMSPDLVSS